MTNITIQDFHHDVAAAEQAAEQGPVLVTEDGKPKNVLLTIDEFRRFRVDKQLSASTGHIGEGSLWDLIQELPSLPEELIDYEFTKMDFGSRRFEFD